MKIQLEEEDKGVFLARAIIETFVWLATIYIFVWLLVHYQSDSKLFWILICLAVLIVDTIMYMLYSWQYYARKVKGLREKEGPKFSLKKEKPVKIKDIKKPESVPTVKDLKKMDDNGL